MDDFFDKTSSESEDKSIEQEFRIPLGDLSQKDIINIFDSINDERRQIVIPIGFPDAGKSLFLSSLIYYSQRYTAKLWLPDYLSKYPFDRGNLSKDQMIQYFDNKEAYPQTKKGTLDLIGINVEPKDKQKPLLKLAFVDLAGDDLEEIKVSNQARFNEKIDGILKGCDLGKPIFCLITPYEPTKGDRAEDQLHFDFMNYVKVNLPNLYNVSRFIILVSQWDKVPKNQKITVEEYIINHRPALHTLISGRTAKIVYGEYSVGELTNALDDKKQSVVLLRRINFHYPHSFWNNLYKVATGKNLEKTGFWAFLKKLFNNS